MAWLSSPVYRSARRYDRLLSLLHGAGYEDRFRRIGERLRPDAWVLDVGCGTCRLAELLPPTMRYTGLDLNRHFVDDARERGLDARCSDVLDVAGYPEGPDVVVVSDMLHHVVPRQREFVAALGRLESHDLVICETLTTGSNALQRLAGLLIDNDGINDFRARLRFHLFEEFTEESLRALVLGAVPGRVPEIEVVLNPGEVRRGVRFHTLTAFFPRAGR